MEIIKICYFVEAIRVLFNLFRTKENRATPDRLRSPKTGAIEKNQRSIVDHTTL